jgi:pyruvate dehydrogenase E1 component alpha subunit/2-oxoisovalerate dehydrogenase E1 component alpha subunit
MGEPVFADLGREHLIELFSGMLRHRLSEERLEILHRQGHVGGGVYRGLGQEAGGVGAGYALRRRQDGTGDFLGQHVRDAGALFLFGASPLDYFRQYMARGTGPTRGKEANLHFSDFRKGIVGPVSPLGTMIEIMAGITLSFRMKGEDRVGMVFYGDGATSTGAWHEGLNFAAVQRCPLLLMVEANQWAFSTPMWKTTRVKSFVEKAPGYGIGAESVDGTDVLEVYQATSRAAERARAGEGAQMVELRYYRMKGHAQHDPQDYIDPEELGRWQARDPIEGFRARILAEGWAAAQELDALAGRVEEEVREAAEQAVAEPLPPAEEALADVYLDVPPRRPWTRHPEPHPRWA